MQLHRIVNVTNMRVGNTSVCSMPTDTRQFVYRVDANDKIVSVNDAFLAFGDENSLPDARPEAFIGKSIWDFITDHTTRHLYQVAFDQVRRLQKSIALPFRCDSPAQRRHMRIQISCMTQGALQATSWIVHIEDTTRKPLLETPPSHGDELLKMCSWCKRVLVKDQWLDLEDAVDILSLFSGGKLPNISHCACQPCASEVKQILEAELE